MTPCFYLTDGSCRIAESVARARAEVAPGQCDACRNSASPQTVNVVTIGVALGVAMRAGDVAEIARVAEAFPQFIDVEKVTKFRASLNLTRAIVRYVTAGLPARVDNKDFGNRVSTCRRCPYFDSGTCNACGCQVAYKAQLPTETCPKDFW
jgi:hypothetical protein